MVTNFASIIIPAFNEESHIVECLDSVELSLGNCSQSYEVIVVDNNSTDRTAELAKEWGAKVVFEPINQIARARNCGASHSKAEHLIFLDADTLIVSQLMEDIEATLLTGKYVGGGARIAFQSEVSLLAKTMLFFWNRFSSLTHIAAGSLIFCQRQAFRQVGGFPKTVYAGEEVYLSRALKKWGKRHRLPFRILSSSQPVQTSARKLEWHSGFKIWTIHILLALFPPLMKSKRFCAFWYERPDS